MAKGRRNHIISVFGFIATAILATLLFPREERFSYEYQQGKPWQHKDLVASIDFPIMKTASELEEDVQAVKDNVKLYYRSDSTVVRKSHQFVEALIQERLEAEMIRLTRSGEIGSIAPNDAVRSSYFRTFQEKGSRILDTLFGAGILEQNDDLMGKPADYIIYVFINQNQFEEKFISEFYTIESAVNMINKAFLNAGELEKAILAPVLLESVAANIKYDASTTEKIQKEELGTISSTRGSYTKGQLIISKGEIINDEKFNVLESYRKAFNKQRGGLLNFSAVMGGQLVFITIILSLLYFFLVLFRTNIVRSFRKVFSILTLTLIILGMVFFVSRFKDVSIYVVPFTILPILVRSFYDTRLALFAHIVTILLAAYFAPNGYEFIVLQLAAGITSIFSFVNFRKRAQLFITVSLIFLCYTLLFSSLTLMREGTLLSVNPYNYLWFFISCFASLFSFPMIYIFEKIFGLFSDITLLELSDTNTSLLRELSAKAPGTFQHSIQVANLAEAAIEEIGGNSLLVRTGALYHDVGKILEPQYFIENQVSGINPHDKLSFDESARKIIQHVEHGVELGRKYGLPSSLIEFIRTHHGTLTVQFFYKSYVKSFPSAEVDKSKFTYPGPIPFSKETAVLMMADGVEAASRSIHEPDYQKIDQLVDRIIDYQISEGQFMNSDITFKDISRVRQIFKHKLMNIYHVRIEYPQ